MALFCLPASLKPFQGLSVILFQAFTIAVQDPQVGLGNVIPLVGRQFEPLDRFPAILFQAFPIVVHEAKVGLRPGIAFSGGTLIPGNGFLAVLPEGFFSILVLGTKFELSLAQSVVGGKTVPFHCFVGVFRHFFSTIVLNAQFILSLGVAGIGPGTQGEEIHG